MNVVDSSAWLEYFAEGLNASYFARAVEAVSRLVVPTICIAEVFKRVLQQKGRYSAYRAVAQMRQGRIVDLDRNLAIDAASLGVRMKLSMADSIVVVTARQFRATIWTQDEDFKTLDGVRYRAKV